MGVGYLCRLLISWILHNEVSRCLQTLDPVFSTNLCHTAQICSLYHNIYDHMVYHIRIWYNMMVYRLWYNISIWYNIILYHHIPALSDIWSLWSCWYTLIPSLMCFFVRAVLSRVKPLTGEVMWSKTPMGSGWKWVWDFRVGSSGNLRWGFEQVRRKNPPQDVRKSRLGQWVPSGKLTYSYGKSPFSEGKSTINDHFQ